MSCESQKYKNLPKCLRCIHCEIPKQESPLVCIASEYGYLFKIKCNNASVEYKGDYGEIEHEFFWQPATNDVWVDGSGAVNADERTDCGHFTAKFVEYPCKFSSTGISYEASPEWIEHRKIMEKHSIHVKLGDSYYDGNYLLSKFTLEELEQYIAVKKAIQ